jgi:hypothetical protein
MGLSLPTRDCHYRQKIPYQGPTFKSFERIGSELKLQFVNIDGGLVVKG